MLLNIAPHADYTSKIAAVQMPIFVTVWPACDCQYLAYEQTTPVITFDAAVTDQDKSVVIPVPRFAFNAFDKNDSTRTCRIESTTCEESGTFSALGV